MSMMASGCFLWSNHDRFFIFVAILLMAALGACTRDEYPQALSDWNQLWIEDGELVVGQDAEPFTINSPL
nr:hypothetical protein [Pseudomonadales bacterium]